MPEATKEEGYREICPLLSLTKRSGGSWVRGGAPAENRFGAFGA